MFSESHNARVVADGLTSRIDVILIRRRLRQRTPASVVDLIDGFLPADLWTDLQHGFLGWYILSL